MRPGNVQPIGQLSATCDAAMKFGLDEKEISAAIIEVCDHAALDDETLDQLNAALARRILSGMRDEAN